MQRVAIIDYGSGNLHSAAKAFERAAREHNNETDIVVTSRPDIALSADRLVLPGVGAYADCKSGILSIDGMYEAIVDVVKNKARPFLGICVGMQLMASRGLEFGETEGFGWIPGDVVAIKPDDPDLKIPHMGWNTLDVDTRHPLLDGIETGPSGLHAYFVHSYHLKTVDPEHVVATTNYGGQVTAMVAEGNVVGTQFHPEKSQALGLKLIANFLDWNV